MSELHSFLRLNNITLHVYTTFDLSIHPLMDIWVIFASWLLWIMRLWLCIQISIWNLPPFLFSMYLEVELVAHMVIPHLKIVRNRHTVFHSSTWTFNYVVTITNVCDSFSLCQVFCLGAWLITFHCLMRQACLLSSVYRRGELPERIHRFSCKAQTWVQISLTPSPMLSSTSLGSFLDHLYGVVREEKCGPAIYLWLALPTVLSYKQMAR